MLRTFAAIFLVIMLSPIFLIIALIILIDDGYPIFFQQKRVGLNNKQFWIYKFRTMLNNTPDIATHLMDENTGFVTRSGRILRKYSLDELPQLFNIILGDIAFIGPRPALYNQYDLIKIRTESGIQLIMPGITGWAQVNGRDELNLYQKVEMDLFYRNNMSVYLDVKILFLTLYKVLSSEIYINLIIFPKLLFKLL